jgi:hypothetical protein
VATVVTTFGTATDAAQGGQKAPIPIPQSLQVEHHAIHEALEAAVKAPGRTGAAAREVAAVLGPHFKREDDCTAASRLTSTPHRVEDHWHQGDRWSHDLTRPPQPATRQRLSGSTTWNSRAFIT